MTYKKCRVIALNDIPQLVSK